MTLNIYIYIYIYKIMLTYVNMFIKKNLIKYFLVSNSLVIKMKECFIIFK